MLSTHRISLLLLVWSEAPRGYPPAAGTSNRAWCHVLQTLRGDQPGQKSSCRGAWLSLASCVYVWGPVYTYPCVCTRAGYYFGEQVFQS